MTAADDHPFRLLGWRRFAAGEFLALIRAHYLAPDGRHLARDIVRHPGAVAVVIVEGDQVVLIRQFRSAVGRTLLEIPAGKLDEQAESPEAAARRECEEEVGLSPRRLEHLASFYTAPGYTDEWISVFLAEDLEPVATRPHGMEEEFAEVIRLGIDDALRMITRGEIVDAKTQIGLLVLAARRSL